MTIDELIALANKYGYSALCMRASQAGVHSPAATITEMSQKIKSAGLDVSMITGDFAVPRNDEHGPDCLRSITPYLNVAQAFGSSLIRICMKKEEDIEWAQKACDLAREHGIRLVHQAHCASLFETVDESLRVLKAVDRENFGIIYEPANWMIAEQDYGPQTIAKIAPYLFNVYVQNHVVRSEGKEKLATWSRGQVSLDHIGIWEDGGVKFASIFEALHDIGYEGYVTVHQAFGGVMAVEEAVRRSAEYLRSFL